MRYQNDDPLAPFWACLSCGAKNPLGQMLAADTVRCPACRSDNIEPADGKAVTVENSNWAIPPVTN